MQEHLGIAVIATLGPKDLNFFLSSAAPQVAIHSKSLVYGLYEYRHLLFCFMYISITSVKCFHFSMNKFFI